MVERCEFCGKSRGTFNRVTYAGAPDGGVPVHIGCTTDFFKSMDGTLEKVIENTEKNCAQCGVIDSLVQQVIVGEPGHQRTHETWLHPACENDYMVKLRRA